MGIFIASMTLAFVLTLAVRYLAIKMKVIDLPDKERKFHDKPTPLFGGLAIYITFWLVLGWLLFFTDFTHKHLSNGSLLAIFLGSTILIIVGLLDDKYKISPKARLLVTAMAALCIILGGTEFSAVTNPFGGTIPLDILKIGNFLVLANIVIFFWLVGMTYTIKILDGLDGLAAGIALIGFLMIYFLTRKGIFYQADISTISLVLAGACSGFLILNFHKAEIFLGESGGLFLGFILGVLAIVAGGKFATALLVLAVPILDLVRVIYLRIKIKQPLFQGDRRHLHFEMLNLGIGHVQAVVLLYLIAFSFGITTLFLKSWGKLIVLFILTCGMVALGIWLTKKEQVSKHA